MSKSNKIMSGDSMAAFLTSTVGMAQEELSKAKELHIRNSIVELGSEVKQYGAGWPLFLLFGLIPFFWPFLFVGYRTQKIDFRETKTRIENALATWKDDLPHCHAELKSELDNIDIEIKLPLIDRFKKIFVREK